MTSKASSRKARTPRVAIIGAGACGIGTGVKLVQAGIQSFEIFDAAEGIGGTWRQNRYPGCSVDVPATLYQYSFKNYRWKRTHPTQAELLAYLEETVAEYGLTAHLRLGTPVDVIKWDDERHCYQLWTSNGDTYEYDIVVSAVGFLNVPNMPDWPGLEEFKGQIFHTAAWDASADLAGKRVAIVGVGSTATQIIPAIQPIVQHLYVFQREPGWVLPRRSRNYSEQELAAHASVIRRKWARLKMITKAELAYIGGPVYVAGSRRNKEAEAASRSYINSVFKDRPDLREAVTPKYVFSGKRRILSDEYYPSLLNDNVELIPRPVSRVTEKGVVDGEGNEYDVDVLIIATGFTPWRYLAHLRVFGREGRDLHEVWREGASAFVGMTVPGFPNFYLMYGPNTNGGGAISIHWLAEQGAAWVLRDIARMRRRRYTLIDTRQSYADRYNLWMQKRLQRTAWAHANNYMRAESGRLVTQFHGSMTLHWLLLHILHPLGTFGERAQRSVDSSSATGEAIPRASKNAERVWN